jgi:ketosteroid isomerase-like protein
VDDQRWGFEEADDWEYQELDGRAASKAAPESEETLVGLDPDGVVEVVVSPAAEVIAVRLSPEWRRSVDPRGLHTCAVTAANMATMRALAIGVEQVDFTAMASQPQQVPVGTDESALTTQDMQRLFDSVATELERFTEQASAVVDRPATVRSAGGHVQGSAQYGQVLSLDIDANWAGVARHGEIESELFEVLRGLRESSTPNELAAGPTGTGISELMELVSDPRRLMRRLGLPG